MSNLNLVDTQVSIAGSPCHFVHLTLHQVFNDHHTFEIKVDYDQLDSLWMANPTKVIQMIGEPVSISMQHRQSGDSNLFSGVITNVSMNGRHGEQNFITVSGNSPTIKLDGTPTLDSFVDLTLDNIANEAVETSGNGGEVSVKPVYKSKIDYINQYEESCFAFLNRLSWLYGEWFFYDGTTTYFGKPDLGDAAKITYDEEMTHFDFSASLIPPKVNRIDYLNHDVNEITADAPRTVPGVRGYIKASLDQSHKVYTSDPTRRLESSILSRKALDDMVKVDKYRMVSQMLTMRGTTQTCKVRIGKLISVGLPGTMRVPLKHVETFLVTEVTHDIDQDGTYQNTFSAIPSEMENIPMRAVKAPVALPQVAWVKSNADERGRVQVQTQWQKKINKTTNWIRVATPDAGSSGAVGINRGFVFIPEEGDLVMLNFENGDPNRPYVSASIFPENQSKGGKTSNALKSIFTRSGIQIVFNDDDGAGSLHISDPSGNTWDMDGRGNINVNAPNNMTITVGKTLTQTCTDLIITASNDIKVTAGNNVGVMVGNNMSETITQDYTLQTMNYGAEVLNKKAVRVSNSFLMTSGDMNVQTLKGDLKVRGMKLVNIQGGQDVKISRG